jgi:AraC-like DNA-binding protein
VEENIKRSYYKLKVLELLLFISNSDIKSITDKFPTLKVENVKKIKEIRNYLICNLDENITLDDLSLKYNVSKTTIKTYFKTIYGKALMTWRREYRLNRASILLKYKDLTVADISQQVGYMDESKFIKAFKKYHGSTPNKYRRKQNN